jgi:hypothetical protein
MNPDNEMIIMKDPSARQKSENALAYAAFLAYKEARDLEIAYKNYMQDNTDALTSLKVFVKWASHNSWQKRVNEIDAEQEMFTKQATRRTGIENSLTAEKMAEELYATCMDEMRLKQGEMTHRDISKYMDICQKINDRWIKQPDTIPVVNVNVEQNVEQTVKTETIDPEMAVEVGRLIALKQSRGEDVDGSNDTS